MKPIHFRSESDRRDFIKLAQERAAGAEGVNNLSKALAATDVLGDTGRISEPEYQLFRRTVDAYVSRWSVFARDDKLSFGSLEAEGLPERSRAAAIRGSLQSIARV